MKKVKRLFSEFQPEHYELYLEPDREAAVFSGRVIIRGKKTGRPSQRLTLHQKRLKITGARIERLGKLGSDDLSVTRINHLPTFEQVRIHAKDMLYPGQYQLTIEYIFQPGSLESIRAMTPSRETLPCIDEAEAWEQAKLQIKQ